MRRGKEATMMPVPGGPFDDSDLHHGDLPRLVPELRFEDPDDLETSDEPNVEAPDDADLVDDEAWAPRDAA
jgi:hypothetical protein